VLGAGGGVRDRRDEGAGRTGGGGKRLKAKVRKNDKINGTGSRFCAP